MAKKIKTNAIRLLERSKVPFQSFQYLEDDENTDGTLVARKNKRDTALVHKTLVARNAQNEVFVFIIPITHELDLKKAAKAAGQKKIEMLPHKELLKYTGYIKGGCSPIGMKRLYPTFIEESSSTQTTLIVSGGKKGHIIEMEIAGLIQLVNGLLCSLVVNG